MAMRSRRVAVLLSIAAVMLGAAGRASAWSNKEHIQLTRMAAERLIADPKTPDAMRQWLIAACPQRLDAAGEKEYFLNTRIGLFPRGVDGLPYWATVPDSVVGADKQNTKVEPYGLPEGPLHYLDIEYLMADEAKRSYAHDLSHKPRLEDIPADITDPRYKRAGMLPFRVRECYQKLVESIRAGRLTDKPGQFPRDDHATKWAGYLAHYLGDNTQPHHATIDYKSATYFADKRGAPNVHAQMEYVMCDDENNDFMSLRKEFWPLFTAALESMKDPIQTDDPWRATLEVALISYDALPLIGQAAMAATKQGGTPQAPVGPAQPFDTEVFFRFKGKVGNRELTVMQMKAEQTAWAVKRIERLWLQAWTEAQKPAAAG